jgi:hypothetical protein
MLHSIPNQLHVCPYCSKRLKPNQLLDRHISSSKSCWEQRSVQQEREMQLTTPYNPEDPDANPQDDPPNPFDFHPEWLFPVVPATDMLGESQADTAQSVNHISKAKPHQEAVNVQDTDIYVEQFPYTVASPLGDADDPFETYKDTCSKSKIPIWHPFKSFEEWELAKFLVRSNLSQGQIDQFLKLKLVWILSPTAISVLIIIF